MAIGGASVARYTFGLVGKDAELREARINIHECGQRTEESAPNPAAEVEVQAHAENAR